MKDKKILKTVNIQFHIGDQKDKKIKPVYLDMDTYKRLKAAARLDRRTVHGFIISELQKRVNVFETGEVLYKKVNEDFILGRYESWNKYFQGLIEGLVEK